ncbi:glycogen biosynthesis protein glgD [Bacillus coahuilensis p1.1.43]|uniref:Glycogen biosynthesis protein glgD n=1 Tax=Bacillus coahuilensis p1.1.43 TaxID=1150625 RepID=A0A147K6I4_9BACI|nr:sugar phosphate nucleotidyltransferase [Bacillus coahuilensis]KUP05454.1 glycogen biosynthesis protein glgD [Bacillus coahuilensis p1.1.43]
MYKSMLGIIDATTYYSSMQDLLLHRSLAAVPVGGRYRFIDFILSSMVNSGIDSVAIFPKYQYRSLMDHLGSGKNWDLNRKRDGLFFLPSPENEVTIEGTGNFHHFAHHLDFFYRSKQEYAVISECDIVCNMDLKPILDRHIENNVDITEVTKKGESLNIFIISTSLLIELIETRLQTGYSSINEVVLDLHHDYALAQYEYSNYAYKVSSIKEYMDVNMSLLDPSIWKQLFLPQSPIFTKVKDEPPTHYGKDTIVKNSMVANGCTIKGNIESSVIFRSVRVGENSTIKNCIIMQKVQIGENCVLEHVILDKDVKVEDNVKLIGTQDNPIVIRKGVIQGELMNS